MQSVDRALDVALIVMQNGGSTVTADRTFSNVLKGLGQECVSAVWRLDIVAVTSTVEGGTSTFFRPVGAIGVNQVRTSEAVILGERVANGEVNAATLESEVERIRKLPSPYNRWALVAAAACAGAAFSQIPGGDWGSLGIAAFAAGVGQFVRSLLQARNLALVNVTFACAILSAYIAPAGLRLGFSDVAPPTLIASVIYMVPGLPLINGFVDVVSHKHLLVGLERIANAAYLFLILAVAIGFADVVVR